MLLARRDKLDFYQRMKAWAWPQRGWERACSYIWRRVWRLSGSPHVIAMGFAAGVFASFTPFMGLHFIIGFGLAWALGGNLMASALGTFIGNPLTFPFIWWLTLTTGNAILGQDVMAADLGSISVLKMSFGTVWDILKPIVLPMVVGGVPIGATVAMVSYWLLRPAIGSYQEKRQSRFDNK